ncbi:MAG: helix-turn-helix domain-containing protein [Planctomycetia bacterium]|nr:helix-turn-helix domain-containing protein [Planctomycetia bacterium]
MMSQSISPRQANNYGEMISQGFISVADAAAMLGCSRASVYDLMEAGKLPYIHVLKCRRIPLRGLQGLLKKHSYHMQEVWA